MVISNLLTVHFQKRETSLKWLIAATAYCLLFALFENPAEKTISLIGKENLWLFSVFCLLVAVSMLSNLSYMYKTFGIESKLFKWVAIVFNAVFPLTLTTLMPPLSANGEITTFSTVMHWVAGFGTIVANATVTLVFCLNIKRKVKDKKVTALFWSGTVICILDALVFLAMTAVLKDPQKSKNGWFEIIPLAVTFIVTYLINHTDLAVPRSVRDESEKNLKACDESVFSALCFGTLAASWATFTYYAFVRNPIHYTISMTGIDYRGGFALVCVLLTVSFLLNFIKMFKNHNYKNYFTIALALIGSVALMACVVSPTTMEKDISVAHSLGAVMFFYFLLAAFSIFLISQSKKNKKYRPFLGGMLFVLAGTIAAVVVLFLILDQNAGRTGLTELIPLEYMFAFLFIENNTNYFESKKEN